jgi:heme oxygenase (biliverdin-IX-beta and delta-forming)
MSPTIKFSSWMLLRLGLETNQHHATADEDRLALMDVASSADYRAQLARIYGFEAAVEVALAQLIEMRERAKAHRLRRDLLALGMSEAALDTLPRCLVRLSSVTQALGWLFVLERHTLLAGLIKRQLEHRFGGDVGEATLYLTAYGDTPGARFRSLCTMLDDHAHQMPAYASLIVGAANEAFRCQRQWYLGTASERESSPTAVGIVSDRSTLST